MMFILIPLAIVGAFFILMGIFSWVIGLEGKWLEKGVDLDSS